MIEKLRYYKDNGAKIVLYTSRNMNSYNGNIGLINKHTATILSEWLEKWNIPYDEIVKKIIQSAVITIEEKKQYI